MVYPFNAPDNSDPICFWQNFAQNSLSSGMVYLMEDNNGKKNAVIQATIPSVGWNIYISEPDSVISGTLAKSVLFFIFILILILILTLGICFTPYISYRKPLNPSIWIISCPPMIHPSSLIAIMRKSMH